MRKPLGFIIVGVLIFLLAWAIRPELENYLQKQELISVYLDYRSLSDEDAYHKYFSPTSKNNLSFNEIEKRRSAYTNRLKWIDSDIIEVEGQDNSWYVKAIESYCYEEQCSLEELETVTVTTWFERNNNQWFLDVLHPSCNRETPYNLPEEFERSLSLISQRFKGSQRAEDQEFGRIFSELKNCLDIRYADSEEDMMGAEGFFYFQEDSPTDQLTILISPRYKYKDDLTTSLLLVHELYHAALRSNHEDLNYSCFDNEANAHIIAYSYFYMMNEDEQNSLLTRYYANTSYELSDYFNTNLAIFALPGDDLTQKFKDYVRSSEHYQSQCGS